MSKDKPKIIRVCPPSADSKGEICVNGVCFQWPDPSIGFKPQARGWPEPIWPCVILGGHWGRQLVYEAETQQTYFEDEAPLFWVYPVLGRYAFAGGEEIVEGFEDKRVLSVAKKYNTMASIGLVAGDGVEIPAARFHLNDLYMDEGEDAFSRSVYMTNLPPQPPEVSVAKMYQANSESTFNEYLGKLKDEGWSGAWVRPNESVWGDLEYFVDEEL